MLAIQDETLSFEKSSEEPYSLSLGIKEFAFLSLIFFLGFTGFSLCLEKIYKMPDAHKIEEITVHQPNLSAVNSNHYQLER